MSQFDADSFLNQEVNANFDSTYTPTPEGEFEGQLDKLNAASFIDKETKEEKPYLKLSWRITDPEVIEVTGIKEPKVKQTVFLDIENGILLEGTNNNIMLGNLREIADKTGNPFTLNDLVGMVGIVRVKHRIMDDGKPSAEVKGVTEI